jgi:chromosome segregation ATPase
MDYPMNKLLFTATSAMLALGLSACSGYGSPSASAGERISERGGQITQYGDTWTSASKAVRDGERLDRESADTIADAREKLDEATADQRKAEANIAKAEADRTRAAQMIADGKVRMERAEADYAAVRAGPAAIPAPPVG